MSATVTPIRPAQGQVGSIRHHEQQARALSAEFSNELCRDLAAIAERCAEASTLSALPPGVRDRLRRLADHIAGEIQGVEIITRKIP